MQQQEKDKEKEKDSGGGEVVRVLCPVERIGEVTRLSLAGGARLRFDCASASPFPSDRVLLISHHDDDSAHPDDALPAALLSVLDRIAAPPTYPNYAYHHQHQHHHQHPVACRLLLSPASPVLSRLPSIPYDPAGLVRVFPKEHAFPTFPGPPYHLLTITGPFPSVKNALLALAPFLLPPVPATTRLLIPSHYLPFVTASEGIHLSHIKQMSGANLTVHEPNPGETTGNVVIFGTPDQTKTAQSLLHGLIFCGVFDPS